MLIAFLSPLPRLRGERGQGEGADRYNSRQMVSESDWHQPQSQVYDPPEANPPHPVPAPPEDGRERGQEQITANQ